MSCPVCGRAVEARFRPFCSRRCADVDLARWLDGSYAIPSTDPEDMLRAAEEAEAAEAAARRKPH